MIRVHDIFAAADSTITNHAKRNISAFKNTFQEKNFAAKIITAHHFAKIS